MAPAEEQGMTLSAEDKKGIDTTLSGFGESMRRMDFDAFGALLTDDVDWVNVVGMHWKGRAEAVKAHRVFFSTMFKDVRIQKLDRQESEIVPGVALVISTSQIGDYTTPDGTRVTNAQDRMTWVLVKRHGRWLIRSAHNTTIDLNASKHDPAKAN